MSSPLDSAPPEIVAALDRLKQDLATAAGDNLVGLVLYGGLARGRFRAGQSDVNVLVLVRDAGPARLTALAPALATARRSANVEPLLLAEHEFPAAALAFPTKFADIQHHRVLLTGSDAALAFHIPRAAIAARVAQELRNLLMRLRYRWMQAGDDSFLLAKTLTDAARPLAIELTALLALGGHHVPDDDRSALVFAVAATRFGLDGPTLEQLAGLRHQTSPVQVVTTDFAAFYAKVLDVVLRVCELSEKMTQTAE